MLHVAIDGSLVITTLLYADFSARPKGTKSAVNYRLGIVRTPVPGEQVTAKPTLQELQDVIKFLNGNLDPAPVH